MLMKLFVLTATVMAMGQKQNAFGARVTHLRALMDTPFNDTTGSQTAGVVANITYTNEDKEKASRYISILDRLLNRNQNRVTVSNTNTNVAATGTATNANTPRPATLPIIGRVPDVSAGVDTILNGVASGNLEQIISGSFIFSPTRVQNIANGVINRVFGGPSISTVNNPGVVAGTGQQNGAGGLVQAVNEIRQNQTQGQQPTVPQQLQPVSSSVTNTNVIMPSTVNQNVQPNLVAGNLPATGSSGSNLQAPSAANVGGVSQQGQLNSFPGQNGVANLINAVLGGILLG